MALTTPILYSMSAFDASQATTFTFNVIGGSQVVANTLTIRNNATLAIVYNETQTTFQFRHTVPANTLINGTYYQATLTTQDADGNVSTSSNVIQFHCYTAPTFEFSNMPNGNVIENASFSFNVTYNQIQGEILNAYVFNLYNAAGSLISTSGVQYNIDTTLPLIISYLISGFEDGASYSIEATGVTTDGTQITTGKIAFIVKYAAPTMFSFLRLANNCSGGYITIESNVIGIDGETNSETPIYIDDKEIDLRVEGAYVQWANGYVINGDFTMRLWGRDFNENTEILNFTNSDNDNITLRYCADDTNCWFELRVVRHGDYWGYVIESEYIALPAADEQIFCWLRRIGNVYELKIENRGVES